MCWPREQKNFKIIFGHYATLDKTIEHTLWQKHALTDLVTNVSKK